MIKYLDVYKRQVLYFLYLIPRYFDPSTRSPPDDVSTRPDFPRDVYKRQIPDICLPLAEPDVNR